MNRNVVPQDRGFTLLEVLVALAILAISLGVVVPALSKSLTFVARAEDDARASAEAQSLLDQVGIEIPLRVGHFDGELPSGKRWEAYVDQIDTGAAPGDSSMLMFKVALKLSWAQGGVQKSIALDTLRLLPKGTRDGY